MRRHAQADAIPEDLRTYDEARWIQRAIDTNDDALRALKCGLTVTELRKDWFVTFLVAPRHYRKALRDAAGPVAGDHHMYCAVKPQGNVLSECHHMRAD